MGVNNGENGKEDEISGKKKVFFFFFIQGMTLESKKDREENKCTVLLFYG